MSTADPTYAEIVNAIDLHLKGVLDDGGVQDYMIAGKRITKYRLAELVAARTEFASLAAREARGGGVTFYKHARA